MSRREPPRARSRRGREVEEAGERTRVARGHRGGGRLPERRQVDAGQPPDGVARDGRPREPGVTRDRKELEAEWRGKRSASSTPAASTSPRRSPSTRRSPSRRGRRVAEADLALFVVDARAGLGPGDQEVADDPAAGADPGDRRREQARQPAREPGRAGALRARPRRSGRRSRRCTATAPATCSTSCSSASPPSRGRSATSASPRRSASRSSAARTSASRASSTRSVGAPRAIVSEIPGTTRDSFDTLLDATARRSG